jgi:hypothetical protein
MPLKRATGQRLPKANNQNIYLNTKKREPTPCAWVFLCPGGKAGSLQRLLAQLFQDNLKIMQMSLYVTYAGFLVSE